jgi:hypothetical protein
MADEKEAKKKGLLVFARECDLIDKKPGAIFYRMTREEFEQEKKFEFDDSREMVFAAKNLRTGQPGMVYEFEIEIRDNGNWAVYFQTQTFVGRWHDKQQALNWDIENRSFINRRDVLKMEKKEAAISLLRETLAPLREKYKDLPYPHRQAFLAAVIYNITS